MRSEGSKRWDKQYYRRSKEGGEEVGGCLPREVQQQEQEASTNPQTSWLPSWCRLFHKKPKKPPTVEKGGGGGRFTVISCDSQVVEHLKKGNGGGKIYPSSLKIRFFAIEPKTFSSREAKEEAGQHFTHLCPVPSR